MMTAKKIATLVTLAVVIGCAGPGPIERPYVEAVERAQVRVDEAEARLEAAQSPEDVTRAAAILNLRQGELSRAQQELDSLPGHRGWSRPAKSTATCQTYGNTTNCW